MIEKFLSYYFILYHHRWYHHFCFFHCKSCKKKSDGTIYDGREFFELTRILSYLSLRTLGQKRTKAEFSNHLRLIFDSSELKFRKIFLLLPSPLMGENSFELKIFLNFNSEESLLLQRQK